MSKAAKLSQENMLGPRGFTTVILKAPNMYSIHAGALPGSMKRDLQALPPLLLP